MPKTTPLALMLLVACGSSSTKPDGPPPPIDAPTTYTVTGAPTAPTKMDLVLAVDNSSSMADKQGILAASITDLISGLVNPACVDGSGQPVAPQPADGTQTCPDGSTRAHTPVNDLHVGLVSSSLGSFGADGCPDKPPASCGSATPNSTSNDDHGHLVTRTDPCGSDDVATYQSHGFLAWDPSQQLTPPGTGSASGLATAVSALVVGDGQLGCGFESQDESWFRFLVDPTPYQSISLVNNQAQVTGTDQALLAQRKQFLRPDSVLAIVVVSDETDASVKEFSSFPLFAAPELHLPHPTATCGFDTADPMPEAPCCYSCGQAPPTGCTPDPACSTSPNYSNADEDTSLRAFGLESHKTRYGIEFFYQPSRYVAALTDATVRDVNGSAVPNPLYTNLDPATNTGPTRNPSLVYFAGVVGVPWQLVARQTNGTPDLLAGFKSAAELALTDGSGNTIWDDIVGDPENYVPPKSPFMVESTVPRSGTDPITGAAISPVTTANGGGASVGGSVLNDHERTIKNPADDIEYACVFDLPVSRDCSTGVPCDCPSSGSTDNPLCNGTQQVKGKAYPGLKELAIAKGLGPQGIVTSICPKQTSDSSSGDFAARPAMRSIVDSVAPAFARQCLAAPAAVSDACVVVETIHTAGICSCDASMARTDVTAAHQSIVAQLPTAAGDCFCEVTEATGAALADCQTDAASTVNGWCPVDPGAGSAQAAVAATCPFAGAAQVRLVGAGAASPGAAMFLACPQ